MNRPKVYRIPSTQNWGDAFTPFLLKSFGIDTDDMIERVPENVKEDDIGQWRERMDGLNRNKAEVFSCGSLIERVPDGFAGHVLGSGMGYEETRCDLTNVRSPLLLRGRLTAERCKYQQSLRFGDPGMLAYLFADAHPTKSHSYGIIPHYTDRGNEDVARWVRNHNALQIDIESGIVKVIAAAASCEKIVSSSLHGLVIADSLDVPSAFVQLSDHVLGDGFKFRDYYSVYDEVVKPLPTIEAGFNACRKHDTAAIKKNVYDVFKEYAQGLHENSTDLR